MSVTALENRSMRTVRSFQSSAVSPGFGKKNSPTNASRSPKGKTLKGKLPSLGALPTINNQAAKVAPVPVMSVVPGRGKRSLEPVTLQKQPEAESNVVKKKSKRKDRRSEDRKMIKDQVAVALKAVREVFATEKGKNILLLETKVQRALDSDSFCNVKVKRKAPTDSLGISFTIPARVMALGWESGQHLVVTNVTPKPGVKSALEVDDIVVAVDNTPCHSIEDLKKCVTGHKKLHFKCIRDRNEVSPEELQATQDRIEKSLKTAVKAKVKESLKARRKSQDL